jgi:hypothetical protein
MRTRGELPAARDDVLDMLEEALSVTPSPEFVARVRQEVRGDRTGATAGWWRALAVAAAALALIVGAAWWHGRPQPAGAESGRTIARTAAVPSLQHRGAPPPDSTSRIPGRSLMQLEAARTLRVPRSDGGPEVHAPIRQVLVSDDERRALDRFLLALREERVEGPPQRRALQGEQGLLREPRPIEIPLMKPIEPLPGAAADGPGSTDR